MVKQNEEKCTKSLEECNKEKAILLTGKEKCEKEKKVDIKEAKVKAEGEYNKQLLSKIKEEKD